MSIIKPQITKKPGDKCPYCDTPGLDVRYYEVWRYWTCPSCKMKGKFRKEGGGRRLISTRLKQKIERERIKEELWKSKLAEEKGKKVEYL